MAAPRTNRPALARRFRALLRAPLAALGRGDRVLCVILTGSRARGDASDRSDIDLVLILREPDHAFAVEKLFRRKAGCGLWLDLFPVTARALERRLSEVLEGRFPSAGTAADPEGALRAVRDGVALLGGPWLAALRRRHAEGLARAADVLRFPLLEPDVRDGLSTIDRGLLIAFAHLGIEAGGMHRKCARIVDACAEETHPHGRALLYDRLVQLTQAFTSRHPLSDPQGNFGSIMDDPPAARRYTEARPTPLARDLFVIPRAAEIEARMREGPPPPTILAGVPRPLSLVSAVGARVPSCLVTGWRDPRMGTRDAIPPFPLGEVADAVAALLANPGLSLARLLQHLPGPDFAAGGEVGPRAAIQTLYAKGRATLRHAAMLSIEGEGDGARVVIAGFPCDRSLYALLRPLALLHAAGKLGEVKEDHDGPVPRLLVAVRAKETPERVLARVRRAIPFESEVRAELRVLVDGEPRVLPLLELLRRFVDAQLALLRERGARELAGLEERLASIDGLLAAAAASPRVIDILEEAPTLEAARGLIGRALALTSAQVDAVLREGFALLVRGRQEVLSVERASLLTRVDRWRAALSSEPSLRALLRDEVLAVKAAHADARRTGIAG